MSLLAENVSRRIFEARLRAEGQARHAGRSYRLVSEERARLYGPPVLWWHAVSESGNNFLGWSEEGTQEEAIGWAVRDSGLV